MKMAANLRAREVLRAGDFLPGRLVMERGSARDYSELERFHYVRERPATWAGVWRVVYVDCGLLNVDCCRERRGLCASPQSTVNNQQSRTVAVGVLSWPLVTVHVRDELLGLGRGKSAAKIRFLNEHVRTISRVIVHPQFRSLGLASRLVRRVCEDCSTRYVEAVAVMGRVHPFFERGGMKRVGECGSGEAYLLLDRDEWKNPGGRCALSRRLGIFNGKEVLS